jgi:hypothetical protein
MTNPIRRSLVLALVMGAALSSSASRAYTIDAFGHELVMMIAPGGPSPASVVDGVVGCCDTLFWGVREVELTRAAGSGGIDFAAADMGDSATPARIRFAPDVVGDVFLIYDMTLDLALAFSPFGGLDISDNGRSGALRFIWRSDAVSTVEVDLYSHPESQSRATFTTPGLGLDQPFTAVVIPFTSFATIAGGGLDPTNVHAITVRLTAPGGGGLGIDLDGIHTTVPEPGTAVLVALGLLMAARLRPASAVAPREVRSRAF